MSKKSYKREEIAAKLCQVDVLHGQGTTLADPTRFGCCMRWKQWSRKTHSSSGPSNTAGSLRDARSWGSANGINGFAMPSPVLPDRIYEARLSRLEIGC